MIYRTIYCESYCFISRQDVVSYQRYIVSAFRYIVSAERDIVPVYRPGIVKYTYTSPNIIYDNDDSALLRSQLFEMASGELIFRCFQCELFKS